MHILYNLYFIFCSLYLIFYSFYFMYTSLVLYSTLFALSMERTRLTFHCWLYNLCIVVYVTNKTLNLKLDWSVNPSLCLLNDDSGLCISSMQKRMLFAGFTAAKKTIIQNWFTPHMCGKTYWIRSLLQIVTCECATARVGGARPSTIDAWQCFFVVYT